MGGEPGPGFGDLLRQLRETALLTQDELARRARLGTRTIQDLERGVHRLARPATARRLAEGLGLTGPVCEQFMLVAHGLIPAGPILASQAAGPQIRHALPPDTAAFTGRDEELSQVTAAVADAAGTGGVVAVRAIDGMPGVGKTALAVHAAHVLRERFPDRQLFIDLHAHTPGREPVRPEEALAGLLAAVGVEPRFLPGDLAGRAAMWRDKMAGQRALLVLDNAASTGQAAPLLPGGQDCLVLVTSRRHLGDLPGMVTPVLLDVLPSGQAEQMFTRLAPRASASPRAVAEVVELAGWLPLAISLLARVLARHPTWTLADLAAETREHLLTLTAERDSIAAAFEVSYRYLSAAQRQLFCLLGLHPGTSIDGYAAAALAGTSVAEAAGLLDGLHQEGLLIETGRRRYGLHDLLRRYAREHAAADSHQALERLLDYYQHTAACADVYLARRTRPGPPVTAPAKPPAGPDLADEGQALAWARAERANLLACLDHATATGQHTRIIAFTAALAGLLRHDGPWADAITRHTTALQAAQHLGDRPGQANALHDLGDVRRLTDDYPGAAQAFERALGIYHELGDQLGQVSALNGLGIVGRVTGDYLGAAQVLERALGICRDLGDRHGQASALHNLGVVRRRTEDYLGAAQALQQALTMFRDLGHQFGEGSTLHELGVVRRLTGDYPGAAQALDQALSICHDLGSQMAEVEVLNDRGTLHRLSGELAQAEECHQQALELARALSSPWDEAHALAGLGRCALVNSHPTQARPLLRSALEIFQRIGAAEAPDLVTELDAM